MESRELKIGDFVRIKRKHVGQIKFIIYNSIAEHAPYQVEVIRFSDDTTYFKQYHKRDLVKVPFNDSLKLYLLTKKVCS